MALFGYEMITGQSIGQPIGDNYMQKASQMEVGTAYISLLLGIRFMINYALTSHKASLFQGLPLAGHELLQSKVRPVPKRFLRSRPRLSE